MKKAISKGVLAVGAALTSGALSFAARDDAVNAATLVFVVAVMFGFLSFLAELES